jgi:site-specific DNA-methyltransferase (adenine-specific)
VKVTDKIIITNEDNMALMSRYEDNYFDLAIVDPPYGIGIDGQKEDIVNGVQIRKAHKFKDWDSEYPKEEYFNELKRVSKFHIIWGANYFPQFLEKSKGWIVWYKGQMGLTMSDCELAYSNIKSPTRVVNIHRTHIWKDKPIHPTQKPVKLYEWLLMNYAKEGDKILDTHLGSGSIAIACHNLGFDLIACELDTEYYQASIKRIKEHISQQRLF